MRDQESLAVSLWHYHLTVWIKIKIVMKHLVQVQQSSSRRLPNMQFPLRLLIQVNPLGIQVLLQ